LLTIVPPLYVFAPARVNNPVPFLIIPFADPLTVPEIVKEPRFVTFRLSAKVKGVETVSDV